MSALSRLQALAADADGAEGSIEVPELRKVVSASVQPKVVEGVLLPVARRGGLSTARRAGTVTPKLPRMQSWSYSGYKQWSECPWRAYLERILKLRQPETPAMLRGTFAHSIMEDYAMSRIEWDEALARAQEAGDKERFGKNAKPCNIGTFKKDLDLARRKGPTCEEEWGLSSAWQDVGWSSPATWLRLKLDLLFPMVKGVLRVVDHKTGKMYDDHIFQTDLYALVSFIKYPEIKKIETEFWYLDLGEKRHATFTRAEVPGMIEKWNTKVRAMLADDQYPCRTGANCRWCPHRQSAGGKCKQRGT